MAKKYSQLLKFNTAQSGHQNESEQQGMMFQHELNWKVVMIIEGSSSQASAKLCVKA
jgi:hypothetical protein